jgi:hypothetical protein
MGQAKTMAAHEADVAKRPYFNDLAEGRIKLRESWLGLRRHVQH